MRLLYTHPAHWSTELIETIANCTKVARYIDMPLQHIEEGMLGRMRRETSRAHIEELIGHLRAGIPGVALRTTFIVGFQVRRRSLRSLGGHRANTLRTARGLKYSQEKLAGGEDADQFQPLSKTTATAARCRCNSGSSEKWRRKRLGGMRLLVDQRSVSHGKRRAYDVERKQRNLSQPARLVIH